MRRDSQKPRRVFRPRRKLPVGMVLRQLLLILILLAGGISVVVLLQRLPEQVDLMVLVSQAIADLISGIQLLLSAMVSLGVVILIAALVILGIVQRVDVGHRRRGGDDPTIIEPQSQSIGRLLGRMVRAVRAASNPTAGPRWLDSQANAVCIELEVSRLPRPAQPQPIVECRIWI